MSHWHRAMDQLEHYGDNEASGSAHDGLNETSQLRTTESGPKISLAGPLGGNWYTANSLIVEKHLLTVKHDVHHRPPHIEVGNANLMKYSGRTVELENLKEYVSRSGTAYQWEVKDVWNARYARPAHFTVAFYRPGEARRSIEEFKHSPSHDGPVPQISGMPSYV